MKLPVPVCTGTVCIQYDDYDTREEAGGGDWVVSVVSEGGGGTLRTVLNSVMGPTIKNGRRTRTA